MKQIKETFRKMLQQPGQTLCRCYKLRLTDGSVIGFTDHDQTLIFEDCVFKPQNGLRAHSLEKSNDLAVDNTQFTMSLCFDDLEEADISSGKYDSAQITLYLVDWTNPKSNCLLTQGSIGNIRRNQNSFYAEYRSLAHLLEKNSGRLYSRQCDATLGDGRCGINLETSAFSVNCEVLQLLGQDLYSVELEKDFPPGWFANGFIRHKTEKLHIVDHIHAEGQTVIKLEAGANTQLKAGESYKLHAGCNKTAQQCQQKFKNIENFRGFPLIPGSDFIMRYPRADGEHLGGSLKGKR